MLFIFAFLQRHFVELHFCLAIPKEFDFYLQLNIIVNIRELLKEDSAGLLKLPTDKALLEDAEFRRYVELYAKVIEINSNNHRFEICLMLCPNYQLLFLNSISCEYLFTINTMKLVILLH